MKSTLALSLLASITVVAADFPVSNIYTKQPNGNPDGQTNYYIFESNIGSTDGGAGQNTAFCWASWGDNSFTSNDAFSDNAPTGQWLPCAHNSSNLEDKTSNFAFMLQPEYSIGNFSVSVQQTYTASSGATFTAQSNPYHISNLTTPGFTCTIDPSEAPDVTVHASGECTTAANSTATTIPTATETQSNTTTPSSNSTDITLTFAVQERTVWGDNVFVVGNISELGNWNPYDAVALSASDYTDSNTLWNGGNVTVPVGTAFEWKYIQWSAGGTLLWECDENRVFTAAPDGSSTELAGSNPDYFRCGNH
ncbi:hypothetical protein B0A55_05953 [Friedmanniomyces simplex]|uniref:CBM20 domain-containing protein n=1 Tax=Friedmanniomyces simplex TaxID=329884 RepID=A0A4U0XFQ3_9PEZI|nr:hypothetical protein B0A55_05953 [Friedmanniomyces simplex]